MERKRVRLPLETDPAITLDPETFAVLRKALGDEAWAISREELDLLHRRLLTAPPDKAMMLRAVLAIASRAAVEESGLTPREVQMVRGLAEGLVPGEIAKVLGVSPATARTQVVSMRHKLRARTAAQAVAIAFRRGIVS